MKIKRTKFVAVLTQTFTTTSTFSSTSRSYPANGDCQCGPITGDRAAVTTFTAPASNQIWKWCDKCATPMVMMSPELAATLCFQTTRAIYRLVEAGLVHFTDGPEGVMVCPASLMKDWAGERSLLAFNS